MSVSIEQCDSRFLSDNLHSFAEILHTCVHDGASIGFILPFTKEDSCEFWRGLVLPAITSGERVLFAANIEGEIAGTVQLITGLPANQAHRAEVAKLLIPPKFRRRGLARILMSALEEHAQIMGKTLLTLDTRTGDTAEPLYTSMGYHNAGMIPGYCRDPQNETYDSTTYMYKAL